MRLKPILFIAIAIGLYFVSHSIGLRGDAAPVDPSGFLLQNGQNTI